MINVFAAQPRKLPQYWWALSLASGATGTKPSLDQPLKVWLLRGTEWWVWECQWMWCRLSKLHRSNLWFHAEFPSPVWERSCWYITLLTCFIFNQRELIHRHGVSKYVSAIMLCFDMFFIGSWEEQISGESSAARFDLGNECVICVPFLTTAFCILYPLSPSKSAKISPSCPKTLRTH